MAKGIYVGVSGVVRKMKAPYIGVGGVARKVKKVFVGVGGVPRLAWSGGIQKIPTTLKLASQVRGLAGGSNVNYALFAGGRAPSIYLDRVEAFNKQLVKSLPTKLNVYKVGLTGVSTDNYVLFAGSNSSYLDGDIKPDAYNTSLVKSIPGNLGAGVHSPTGVSNGNYAFIGGGTMNHDNGASNIVNHYNILNLERSYVFLTKAMRVPSSATTGKYALFGEWEVESVDTSLVKKICEPIRRATGGYTKTAVGVGKYALFIRNNIGTNIFGATYDENLVKSEVSNPLYQLQYSSVGITTKSRDYAVIACTGSSVTSSAAKDVYTIDTNLIVSRTSDLVETRSDPAGAVLDDYLLICGGAIKDTTNDKVYSDAVDIYET